MSRGGVPTVTTEKATHLFNVFGASTLPTPPGIVTCILLLRSYPLGAWWPCVALNEYWWSYIISGSLGNQMEWSPVPDIWDQVTWILLPSGKPAASVSPPSLWPRAGWTGASAAHRGSWEQEPGYSPAVWRRSKGPSNSACQTEVLEFFSVNETTQNHHRRNQNVLTLDFFFFKIEYLLCVHYTRNRLQGNRRVKKNDSCSQKISQT